MEVGRQNMVSKSCPKAALYVGRSASLKEMAASMLPERSSLVAIVGSLPAAVALREALEPALTTDAQGVPLPRPLERRVSVYPSSAGPVRRRDVVNAARSGAVSLLIVAADDLRADETLQVLLSLEKVTFLVDDAQALLPDAERYLPGLRRLLSLLHQGTGMEWHFFLPLEVSSHISALCSLLEIRESDVIRPEGPPAHDPEIRFEITPTFLAERAQLSLALTPRLAGVLEAGGVLVTQAGALSATDATSFARELGARSVYALVGAARLEPDAWLPPLHDASAVVVTDEPDAAKALATLWGKTVLRLSPPAGTDTLLLEAQALGRHPGGRWIYLGPAQTPSPASLAMADMARLGAYVVKLCGQSEKPMPVDLEALGDQLELSRTLPRSAIVQALSRALEELVQAGLLSVARPAHFVLEVAEAHRFCSPHIDADPRYGDLRRRYQEALSKMDLRDSVKYRLEARTPKDFLVLSAFLGLSVGTLNTLFADLAAERIILSRQSCSGNEGNLNVELLGTGNLEAMSARLPLALEALSAGRERLEQKRGQLKETMLSPEDPTSPASLSSKLEAVVSIPLPAPVGTESIVLPSPLPSVEEILAAPVPVIEPPKVSRVAPSRVESAPAPESLLPGDDEALSRDALLTWEARLYSAPVPLVQAMCRLLEAEPTRLSSVPSLTVYLLALRRLDLGDLASLTLIRWLEAVSAELRRELLLPLLADADYRLEAEGRLSWLEAPSALVSLALLLPALEQLSKDEVQVLVARAGFAGDVMPLELGVVRVKLEERAYLLRRNGTSPEQEAALWAKVGALRPDGIPTAVISARATEAYLMVAGLVDESLASALASLILATDTAAPFTSVARWELARARVLLNQGEAERALRALDAVPEAARASLDVRRLYAEAEVAAGRPFEALKTLLTADIRPHRGEGADLWRQVSSALMGHCDRQTSCALCALRESAFCPPDADFTAFLERNPYAEPKKVLRSRLERRWQHGVRPESLEVATRLVERYGCVGDVSAWTTYFADKIASSDVWLALARALLHEGMPEIATEAVNRISLEGAEPRILGRLVFARLDLGDLASSLELAQTVEGAHPRFFDRLAYGQRLAERLGEDWVDALERHGEGLTDEAKAFLTKIAESITAHRARAALRQRLEQALERGALKEIRGVLEEYLQGADEAVKREPLVTAAQERLAERRRKLETRIQQLMGSGLKTGSQRGELHHLAEEAALFGMAELASKAKEQAQAALQAVQEAQKAARSRDAARADSVEGDPAPEASGLGGEATGPRQGARAESDGQRSERRARSDRPERPNERDARRRDDRRRPERRDDEGARSVSQQRDAGEQSSRRPVFEDDGALSAALKEARSDRERLSLFVPTLAERLKADPEKAIKLLRDVASNFQYVDMLDRPVSRLVGQGLPSDEHLSRFKRIVQKLHEGRNFTATLSEISSRENPEPWKQVLSQLRLKG